MSTPPAPIVMHGVQVPTLSSSASCSASTALRLPSRPYASHLTSAISVALVERCPIRKDPSPWPTSTRRLERGRRPPPFSVPTSICPLRSPAPSSGTMQPTRSRAVQTISQFHSNPRSSSLTKNTKARHPAMSRLSNIFVIHSKLLISTTLHEHGTESQCDVFSHCKDRPYSRTLQLFSPLFGSVIATPPAYSDKYREHLIFLSRRINFCSFFLQGIVLQNEMERL